MEVIPGIDDLLVPGTEERLPENPPPSALLNARYQVVPFHEQGRESILAELDRWSDEGPPVAVRLVHAEGGVGKTRLAIEWIRRREAQGWAAGFLPKDVPEDWFERLCALNRQVLVVIDYAESRSELRAALMRVLRYAQQKGPGALQRIRLLLLARNAGDWWQSLQQSDAALGAWLVATPPTELTPLAPQLSEREKVFHEAAEKFAKERGKTYQRRVTIQLTEKRFERVLYLHMAALAAVEDLKFEANSLIEVVLDHEERFWEARARLDDVTRSFQKSMARQVVAAATLRGGLSSISVAEQTAERILRHALSVLGDALAAQLEERGDFEVARELEAVGILQSTVSLRRVREWVNRTLLQGLEASEEEGVLAEKARLHHNLSISLSELRLWTSTSPADLKTPASKTGKYHSGEGPPSQSISSPAMPCSRCATLAPGHWAPLSSGVLEVEGKAAGAGLASSHAPVTQTSAEAKSARKYRLELGAMGSMLQNRCTSLPPEPQREAHVRVAPGQIERGAYRPVLPVPEQEQLEPTRQVRSRHLALE